MLKKNCCLTVFLLFFLLLIPTSLRAEVNLNAYPDRGFPAPDFTLYDVEGRKHTLSDYKGKVVLLNVWATWCYPCIVEMPAMEALYRKLKDEDFAVLAVSIDKTDPKAINDYIQKNQFSFSVLLSPDGLIQSLYQTRSIPATFIIDKSGMIVSRIPGAREWNSPEAIQAFQRLIDE